MRVSVSKIKLFKGCRRAYYLKYIEGLEPVQKAEALQVGTTYHKLIETMYKDEKAFLDMQDNSKEYAMAMAYRKYIYPKFQMKSVEDWFDYGLPTGDTLIGITDGITEDGTLVEHKTKSGEITEQYEYDLLWDEQILAYMLVTGSRKIYYTVCRKPTIRQKQTETEAEFFDRMLEWYDTDTYSKIRLLKIERTNEEVMQFKDDLIDIVSEMKDTKRFYKNCRECNLWGRRCEYSSICLNYDPDVDYVEFERRVKYGTNGN